MRESKECLECGGLYFRGQHVSDAMWEARKYCSGPCAGKAGARRLHPKKEEAAGPLVAEVAPEEVIITKELGPVYPLDPVVAQTVSKEPKPERQPIIRELKIVRVGPNPRLLVCEYFELAQRRTCTVDVKRTAKYVRGMKFKMAEPVEEQAYRRPWVYTGAPPRWRGRW